MGNSAGVLQNHTFYNIMAVVGGMAKWEKWAAKLPNHA